jgi:colicin import membrane protein
MKKYFESLHWSTLTVMACHVAVLLILGRQAVVTLDSPAKRRMAVQTVQLEPPPPKPKPRAIAPVPKPRKPIAKVQKPKLKPKPKPRSKPKPKPKAKPRVEPQRNREREELLRQVEQSLEKIETVAHNVRTETQAERSPPSLEPLHIDQSKSTEKDSAPFRNELVRRLQLLLRLPDYGEVQMKLTLDRSGKVANLLIVSSQSPANQAYVEKTLPTLAFAKFGRLFPKELTHTFSLTLQNER